MLTSYQASPVAFWPDPDVYEGLLEELEGPVCSGCADEIAEGELESGEHDELFIHYYNTPNGFQPASRYGVEEAYPGGLDCSRCGETITEPDPDWCDTHYATRAYRNHSPWSERPWCEEAEYEAQHGDGLEALRHCAFHGFEENPPAPRWVPCSSCRAGDGEPHRDGCKYLQQS